MDRPSGITIERVEPEIDCGRHPVKRLVGQKLVVWADMYAEAHDRIQAVLKVRPWLESEWRETPMRHVDNDRWTGSFGLEENTRYLYTLEAWKDRFGTWQEGLRKKVEAGTHQPADLLEGQALVRDAAGRAAGADRRELEGAAERLPEEIELALSEGLLDLCHRYADPSGSTTYDRELVVMADRRRAAHGAWYEFFPRSTHPQPARHGTFQTAERELERIAGLGFDVAYLPPVHPIGKVNRKGRNNALEPEPEDVGSPWAIGCDEGGHKDIHPQLGTVEDFRHFVRRAEELGLEVALDFAIQCAPDHPWAREHPEWFHVRPDGSIKFAENPPKKYEDIYPVNFYNENWRELWDELRSVVQIWIERGVKIFRVDNPHTKPIAFWRWLMAEVHKEHPEVIFLAEAFTRPKVMKGLAKIGFQQSYTYFTWRNFKQELTDYLTELNQTEMAEYFRGNFFVNTPDILHEILQKGGRPAFQMRLVLAATLSSVYGVYSGFELCENVPLREGSEEYLDAEKYQIRQRDWDAPGNINDTIRQVNRIRRQNPALQESGRLRFFEVTSDQLLFYGKMTDDRSNIILVVVNLDPFSPHEGMLQMPLEEMGMAADETYEAHELLRDVRHMWSGRQQWVRLDPQESPAEIFRVVRWPAVGYREPCF